MMGLVANGIRARKLRSALTALSIVLGVAMISGTFVLTGQIDRGFDAIFEQANKGTDAVVLPHARFGGDTGGAGNPVPLYLPQSLVARAASAPGAARAAGSLTETGYLDVDGTVYKPKGGAPAILASADGRPFESSRLVRGSFPRDEDQVAVGADLADRSGVVPGQRVRVATGTGLHAATVSGIVEFPASIGGSTFLLARLGDIQRWYGEPGRVTAVDVAAKPGVSQSQLAASVRRIVGGPGIRVKTGEQDAKDSAGAVNKAIGSFLTPALLAFGFIAVFVGAFIIFNTFSITVAQRVREFAMLRALGAARRQVMGAVVWEAIVIGLAASAVGIGGGYLVAAALTSAFDAAGVSLPEAGATIPLHAIAIGLIVGVGTTLVASIGPARRATRIAPVAALREGAVIPRGLLARWSPAIALLLAAAGCALIASGFRSGGGTSAKLLAMAAGAVLVFFAVATIARYLVPAIVGVLGWPVARLSGGVGGMARDNARRNPARTAVTSSALMVGLAIAVFVAVFAQGLKVGIGDALSKGMRGNVVVQSSGFTRIPGTAVAAVAHTPGVASAAAIFTDRMRLADGSQHGITGIAPDTFPDVWKIRWIHGSDDSVRSLGTGGFIIDQDLARSLHLHVGRTIQVQGLTGRHESLVLRGIYDGHNSPLNGVAVSTAAFDRISTNRNADVVLARTASGVSAQAGVDRVERAVTGFPTVDVQTSTQYTSSQQSQLDPVIYLIYALLSMSVIVSLFGIVNTLVLSVFERTREIGMLRAIGLTRRQTRRMVRYESVITALIGAVLGTGVGLFFGWVMAEGLRTQGVAFSVPAGQLAAFVVLAGVAGVLAAILPARRAARLDVLDALRYE
jgi:putative ABC transport system permease protein